MSKVLVIGAGALLASKIIETLNANSIDASEVRTLELQATSSFTLTKAVGLLAPQIAYEGSPPWRNTRPYLKRKKGRS